MATLEGYAEKKGVPVDQLSQKDVDACYAAFPDRVNLQGSEQVALEQYGKGARGHWETPRLNSVDAQALEIDLLDRIASLDPEEGRRNGHRQQMLKKLDVLIQSLPHTGQQSELKLLYILRALSLENNAGHLVAVSHGLPREDMADEKVDLHLQLGTMFIPLQVKTEVMSDEYRAEHYEKVRQRASEKIKDQKIKLLVIDVEALDAVYAMYGKDGGTSAEKNRATRAKNQLLEALAEIVPEEAAGCFELLKEKKKSQSAAALSWKLKDAELLKVINIPFLVSLGLLQPGVVDAVSVKKAKELLVAHRQLVRQVFQTPEALAKKDPECINKMRTALQESRAQAA